MKPYVAIENPMVGKTYYHIDRWGVYRYDEFPHGSVLEGSERRTMLDAFTSLEAARKEYPTAEVAGGSGYHEIPISHMPPEWFRSDDIGEIWDDEE